MKNFYRIRKIRKNTKDFWHRSNPPPPQPPKIREKKIYPFCFRSKIRRRRNSRPNDWTPPALCPRKSFRSLRFCSRNIRSDTRRHFSDKTLAIRRRNFAANVKFWQKNSPGRRSCSDPRPISRRQDFSANSSNGRTKSKQIRRKNCSKFHEFPGPSPPSPVPIQIPIGLRWRIRGSSNAVCARSKQNKTVRLRPRLQIFFNFEIFK